MVQPKPRKLTRAEALEQARAQIKEDQPGLSPSGLQPKITPGKESVTAGLPCPDALASTSESKLSSARVGYGRTE
jgi:hypothetical protein